jgi:uncharacterized protein YprB with RNaseH-like and TPR domain
LKLADRLRSVINTPSPPDRRAIPVDPRFNAEVTSDLKTGPTPTPSLPLGPTVAAGSLEEILGGVWTTRNGASCFVVEREFPGPVWFGRTRVQDLAAGLAAKASDARVLVSGAPDDPTFVFFDLETTGLSGGAGTCVFLVGFGGFRIDGGFATRQYVMARYGDERAMLSEASQELQRAGVLTSFNGKSFDAPLLETRYLFHRLEWPGAGVPHLDALHAARQFWGEPTLGSADGARDHREPGPRRGCSLLALEQQVFGVRRAGDVPGGEIPDRYFRFVRSGNPQALAVVLEHNRADLLSLAALTSRLLQLVAAGPDEARRPREALALGRVYARAGLYERARNAFARALAMSEELPGAGRMGEAAVRIAALRALARTARRMRRFGEAAGYWRALLAVEGCPAHLAREASEALAVHHEHRLRDLPAAKMFALRSLGRDSGPRLHSAVQRRLTRIERKLERGPRLWACVGDEVRPS